MEYEVRGACNRRIQVAKMPPGHGTAAKRRAFLDALAATCNVKSSLAASGWNLSGAYKLRRSDPGFARSWEVALEIGYQRLEEQLLERALAALDEDAIDPEAAGVPELPPLAASVRAGRGKVGGLPVEYHLALAPLARRDAVARRGADPAPRRRMSTAEVNALLVRKLDALSASRARARDAAAGGDGDGDGDGGNGGGA